MREKLFAKSLSLKLSFQKLLNSKQKGMVSQPFLFNIKVTKSWFRRNSG